MTIQKNSVVTINYTLSDETGDLIESSEGQEPLTYLHGQGNIIPIRRERYPMSESKPTRSAGDSTRWSAD